VRVYARSNGILHVTPLFDWPSWEQASQPFWFFPESPGAHDLRVSWAAPNGTSHFVERPVKIAGASPPTSGPQLADVRSGLRLWAPSPWEAQALRHHETELIARLPEYVKRGSVVYDIGANLGLYSIVCGRLAGSSGRVYAFEANPVCLYFLRANLSSAGIASSEILPVALADGGDPLEFIINYDNLNLGLAASSAPFPKAGHHIRLASRDLDGLVAEFQLRAPDVIKMDIEGGETAAVRGMSKTLQGRRAVLLLELHGKGAASDTLSILDSYGYRYLDIRSGRRLAGSTDVVAQMPDAPVQIAALPE
jgi:FkbM family methyltransferase